MAEVDDPDNKKLALSYAADNRKTEIALLWSRSLYFWGFISVILVAYGSALQAGRTLLALIAACFGFLCSLCWTLANRSGKYWQTVWEEKTKDREKGVLEPCLFPRSTNPPVQERWFFGPKQYSPSKLAIAVSDLTALIWIILIVGTALPALLQFKCLIKALLILSTVIYTAIVLIWCRSGPPLDLLAWIRQKVLRTK